MRAASLSASPRQAPCVARMSIAICGGSRMSLRSSGLRLPAEHAPTPVHSLKGASGRRSELANDKVGDLTGHRQLALSFKPLDGTLRVGVNDSA
jgi:hypothetical protein